MNYFVYWTKLDRSDKKTVIFKDMNELNKQISESRLKIHYAWNIKNFIEANKTSQNYFYAFPSKIKNEDGLEWHMNLNQASKAQKEYQDFLKRIGKKNLIRAF